MNITDMLARMTTGRAVLIGAVVGAFYYFLMYDNGSSQTAIIAQSNQRITELQAQIQADQKRLDSAAVYKKTAAEVGNTITKLLSLIPEQFNMADLMRLVSNEAKVAGTSLASIEPRTTEISNVAGEFEELMVAINMSGSFLQHMVFLSNLTKVNQILVVRKLELRHEAEGKGDEAPTVALVADILAYRYRGQQSKAGAQGTGQ
ncbi:MAG TPA: type 4a pilus biogenesis protein PilO [Bdellovibrionales bacterium]|nr:type 4a pilus biogenesis protein PilO [Bdellovibrionales bacterium]